MSSETRPYRKQARAEAEAQTRLRITESAMELHGTLGPARTTMSAVAEHAGVRRSTLYRHFPDEEALFAACSAHWDATHPAPDPARWSAIADPASRTAAALAELYAFYRDQQQMLSNLARDRELVPVVDRLFSGFDGYLDAVADTLLKGRPQRGRARAEVRGLLRLAVDFSTWRTLTAAAALDDERAAAVMCRAVEAPART